MTIDALRKAMRKAISSDVSVFYGDMPQTESDQEIIDAEVDRISTPELLDYINQHMQIFSALSLNMDLDEDKIDYTADAIQSEMNIGHNIEYVPKLFNERVFFMGEEIDSYGGGECATYMTSSCAFITEDGTWKFATAKTIRDDMVECTMYQSSDEEVYYLDNLKGYIPDEYIEDYFCY